MVLVVTDTGNTGNPGVCVTIAGPNRAEKAIDRIR